MKTHRLYIDGIALWSPALPNWAQAQPALLGDMGAEVACETFAESWGESSAAGSVASRPSNAAERSLPQQQGQTPVQTPVQRPSPALLGANERRRAPDSVLVALEVAAAAVAMAGQDAATLASVFTSAHGDLAIVDALCTTLAANPQLLSPTRFHHSVHNAASGYWAMATGCRAASSAVSAYEASFAVGLLEAATQAHADHTPVLLVGFDTDARGALASVNRSRGLLGVALVLAPQRSAASRFALDWSFEAGSVAPPPLASAAARALAGNAMADALPLFEALARETGTALALPLGPAGILRLQTICLATALPP